MKVRASVLASFLFATLASQFAWGNFTPSPAAPFADPPPSITVIGRIIAGTTAINGVADKSASVQLQDTVSKALLALQGGSVSATADKTTGAFTLNLATPLSGGAHIQFLVNGAPAAVGGDSSPTKLDIAAPPSITIIGRIVEGTTAITGIAADKTASVQVQDMDSKALLALQGSAVSAPADKTTGVFTLNLAEPLYSGERVQFLVNAAPAAVGGGDTATELDIHALGDWGRVRANFALGAVLSFDNSFQLYNTSSTSTSSSSNTSQATLFLDFNLEKNWVWAGVAPDPKDATKLKPTRRVLFSTYFEGRLTSVPVSVCPSSTAATTTPPAAAAYRPEAASGTPASSSSTSSSSCGSGTSGTDALTTFLSSAKSAELQGGAYLPILTSVWSFQNAPNALFIAPLARVGFITPTGSTTSGSTSVQSVNNSNFYNFYGFGARVGHFKMSNSHNIAPELMSYFDVMFGRYSNLDTLQATPTGTVSVRRWRVAIEGALKVPSTPLILGVSANIGQNLTGPPTVQATKDDLRFFIGAKFDVGKLLAKIPGF
jgi:hypothetical protein